jgi:hypothetical protein
LDKAWSAWAYLACGVLVLSPPICAINSGCVGSPDPDPDQMRDQMGPRSSIEAIERGECVRFDPVLPPQPPAPLAAAAAELSVWAAGRLTRNSLVRVLLSNPAARLRTRGTGPVVAALASGLVAVKRGLVTNLL